MAGRSCTDWSNLRYTGLIYDFRPYRKCAVCRKIVQVLNIFASTHKLFIFIIWRSTAWEPFWILSRLNGLTLLMKTLAPTEFWSTKMFICTVFQSNDSSVNKLCQLTRADPACTKSMTNTWWQQLKKNIRWKLRIRRLERTNAYKNHNTNVAKTFGQAFFGTFGKKLKTQA